MGYTHYMRDLQANEQIAEATRICVANADCFIGNWEGVGEPVITPTHIELNGDASCGLDHETFALDTEYEHFNFCKTARKPYDKVVTAILTWAIANHSPGWESIGSDGDLIDWTEGIDYYESLFGELSEGQFADIVGIIGGPSWYLDGSWNHFPPELVTRANWDNIKAVLGVYE